MTPARGAPALSLAYASGNGNGPFGAGWQLSVPRIARKTEQQLPTYGDGEDTFVLSGAEDLVPVPGAPDGVQWYRPRVETAYARIEQHLDASGTWWASITGDNTRNIYGRSSAARIARPGDPRRVFAWLLESTEDALGNLVQYDYLFEDTANVASSAPERHRLDGTAPCTNTYLSAVRYGSLPTGGFAFKVAFDYGGYPGTWPVRPDPFSSYRSGFDIRTYRRCVRIQILHDLPELGASPQLVRELELTYDDDPALSHLVAVEHRGYDDAGSMVAIPALKLAYTVADPAAGAVVRLDTAGDLPAGVDGTRHQWVDLDAEGIAGVLTHGDGGLYYRRNVGNGALGSAIPLATLPGAAARARSSQRLMSIDGDGRMDVVDFSGPAPGFYARERETWESLQPFISLPILDWGDPDIRFIDLDGDGLDDLLISRDDSFLWYPSLGTAGYDAPRVLTRPSDEELGPAILFSDPRRTIALADLSGDGLRDLVRVENGSVCYWPNLGQGRFGAKVAMANPPVFDLPDQFQPARVLFADIDGTGTTDILYAGAVVTYWLNQAGNGWSAPVSVSALPPDHTAASITAIDVLGTGTACLAWSSAVPGDTAIRYVDLMGGVKPHLLAEVDNQLGLTTRIAYASSTSFYLADRAVGIQWATQLPFPVHVVARVEVDDAIRRVRFVSEYRYRDGYFDGHDREFRGFGYVEQRDTESDPAAQGKGLFGDRPPPVNDEYPQPPVVTKTWSHTGVWLDDGPTPELIAVQPGLTPDESRDAYRALRNKPLRTEIYAEDGKPQAATPYLVTQYGYSVARLFAGEPHGVFAANPRETITTHSERTTTDVRVQHALVIEVDDHGHVRKSVVIGYASTDPAARPEQRAQLAMLAETDLASETAANVAWYRHGVPVETRTYELVGLPRAAGAPLAFDIVSTVALDPAAKLLLARTRMQYYDSAALPAQVPLAFGIIDARALPFGGFALAFTPALLGSLYGGRVTDAMLAAGGYVQLADDPGNWYSTSGRAIPEPAKLYLPTSFVDPFGTPTSVGYDPHLLAITSTSDVFGNAVSGELDYRVFAPTMVIDPNGCSTRVAFDALGRVAAVWVTGPAGEGDPFGGAPTAMYDYRFYDAASGQPSVAHSAARETHALAATKWQHAYVYTDGAGAAVMTKRQAEPGPDAGPRWIGNGRTVFDNKGNPLKQYEPYFSTTSAYETEDSLVAQGVTPLFHYDALGRRVLSEFPDGSTKRVELTPWQQVSYDGNDTVADAGNRWLARARTGTTAEQRAATVTLPHANTPTVVYLDSLGRTFAAVADNGGGITYETRTTFDLLGNPLSTIDALGRTCASRGFNLLGQSCYSKSIDAGERWSFVDVMGRPLYHWDGRGQLIETTYDALRRKTAMVLTPAGGTPMLVEKALWGEASGAPYARTRLYQTYDGAGVATMEAYDFKGNLASTTRQLATQYDAPIALDWTSPQPLEQEVFRATTRFDALNRPTQVTSPDGSVFVPRYNAASLLDEVTVTLPGATAPTSFASAITYNEKSQRTAIRYGTASTTTYTYDPYTYRISTVQTARASDGAALQALAYTYDPEGNVLQCTDGVQQPVFYAGGVVDGTAQYTYEPIYRLSTATGREHAGGFAAEPTDTDLPVFPLPHENDGQALISYFESYRYDPVGNVLQIAHGPPGGAAAWISPMRYVAGSNQIDQTMTTGDRADDPAWHGRYSYDGNGNTTAMPHLAAMTWTWRDQLQTCDLGGGGIVYFTYDGTGERMRKVWVHGGTIDERIYIGGYEIYRQRKSGVIALERQTLHVRDGAQRFALVETKTIDTSVPALSPVPVIRYQLCNHLGSVAWEIDRSGNLISYEEYHPYGTSAYRAQSAIDVSLKRYRYTGKERDEETSLEYHSARYYSPWLARWTSTDPKGLVDSASLYVYVADRPVCATDPNGRELTANTPVTTDMTEAQARRVFELQAQAIQVDQAHDGGGGTEGGSAASAYDLRKAYVADRLEVWRAEYELAHPPEPVVGRPGEKFIGGVPDKWEPPEPERVKGQIALQEHRQREALLFGQHSGGAAASEFAFPIAGRIVNTTIHVGQFVVGNSMPMVETPLPRVAEYQWNAPLEVPSLRVGAEPGPSWSNPGWSMPAWPPPRDPTWSTPSRDFDLPPPPEGTRKTTGVGESGVEVISGMNKPPGFEEPLAVNVWQSAKDSGLKLEPHFFDWWLGASGAYAATHAEAQLLFLGETFIRVSKDPCQLCQSFASQVAAQRGLTITIWSPSGLNFFFPDGTSILAKPSK